MLRVGILLAFAALALAQVPHAFDAYTPRFSRSGRGAAQSVALNPMDLASATERANKAAEEGIWEFAEINHVSLDLFNETRPEVFATGSLRVFSYEMSNAKSFAFFFDHFFIPEGGALFIVSDEESAGPFTHENNWKSGKFQTRHVRGSRVELHYFEVPSVQMAPILHLAVVTTAFRDARDRRAMNAGACNVNAACVAKANTCNKNCSPTDRACSVQCTYIDQDEKKGQWAGEEWGPNIRGTVAVGRSFNSRYCSGSFINNVGGKQYVLTAAHCGPAQSDIVLLHFDNADCSSVDDAAGPTEYSVGDITTLASDSGIDNELIEIGETIPADWNVYLNGYDSTDQQTPSNGVVGIHHPSGANKKISYSDRTVEASAWFGGDINHWRVSAWSVATTEPGSSGSPLFSHATRRIIGQLHGGSAACPALNGYDMYGAVWAGYANGGMAQFLGPPSMDGEELATARKRRIVM